MNELHVDLSFPYCPRRCDYCDSLVATGRVADFERYADALVRELRAAAPEARGRIVMSVRFSGGSPVLMPPKALARVMDELRNAFEVAPDADAALQATCAGLSFDALGHYRKAGITFLELGQETFDGVQHDALGLCYPMNSYIDARQLLTFCSWDGLGMSLLYGLPGQNRVNLSTSIVNAVGFGAREIALAPLRLRPGSALHERYAEHPERFDALPRKAWPTDDERLALRAAGEEQLVAGGFTRVTQHLFSADGTLRASQRARCDDVDRLGVGAGAWSKLDGVVSRSTGDLTRYLAHAEDVRAITAAADVLTPVEASCRYVAGRLFAAEGFSHPEHERRFGASLPVPLRAELERLAEAGWATCEGDRWKLTCEGGHRYDDAVRRLAAAAQAEKEAAGHRGAGASPRVAASA